MTKRLSRRAHFLRSSSKTETPVHAIWFDTESAQDEHTPGTLTHRLTFGWAAYRRRHRNGQWSKPEWFRFTHKSQFWDFVEDHTYAKGKLYIFCHNTSFDIPLLDGIRILGERAWKLSLAVIDAPPTILKYRRDKSSMVVLDTLNIFRMPLAALGKNIGLEKYDMPDVEINSAEGDRYCKRDVEIIMESCLRWWQFLLDNDLGSFANTLASQSMKSFRHRFMDHKILIDDNADATEISRAAYYGGRTECFRLGVIPERTWLFDVNSMYPAVMHCEEYPTRLAFHDARPTTKEVIVWLAKYAMTAEVELRTDEPCYAVRRENKLIFPVGRFTTFLSTPEILYALHNNHIVKFKRVACYHKAPIFKTFVEFTYTERLRAAARGEHANALLYKILMNSLYGKFGQRGLVWDAKDSIDDLSARSWEEYDADTGTITRYRQFGGLVQRQETESESRESHPAIAAHVTAYARLLLWDMINTAGRDNVYYVDTDSLLVNKAGKDRLINILDETKLGALKLEAEFADAEIFGPKDYRFGDRRKTKGVKKSALWTSINEVEQQHWSTLAAHIRQGADKPPTTKTVKKTLKRIYNKGTVSPDGHIEPYLLNGESAAYATGS